MSREQIKILYDSLAESGDLQEMFPGMTGDWKKDQTRFCSQYENDQFLTDNLYEEDDYEADDDY